MVVDADDGTNANGIGESGCGYDAARETWAGAFEEGVEGCVVNFLPPHSNALLQEAEVEVDDGADVDADENEDMSDAGGDAGIGPVGAAALALTPAWKATEKALKWEVDWGGMLNASAHQRLMNIRWQCYPSNLTPMARRVRRGCLLKRVPQWCGCLWKLAGLNFPNYSSCLQIHHSLQQASFLDE